MHLNAMHSSHRAFIRAESSERIHWALRHQIRMKDQIFISGDAVYYKRDGEQKWRGPGKVIGQDGKVIFVRHGNVYVRVAPSRLIKAGREFSKDDKQRDVVPPDTAGANAGMEKKTAEGNHIDSNENPAQKEVPQPDEALEMNSEGKQEQPAAIQGNTRLLKIENVIHYKAKDEGLWQTAKVLSRAGKATGKYASCFNTEDLVTRKTSSIDFKNGTDEWKTLQNEQLTQSGDPLMTNIIPTEAASSREAKIKELDNWKSFHVYDEVSDQGQCYLATWWVITEKESGMKARLVVRGFEEE